MKPFDNDPCGCGCDSGIDRRGFLSAMGAAAGDRELEKQLEKTNASWLAGKIEKAFERLLKAFDEALGDDGYADSAAATPISWAERALAMILSAGSDSDDERDNEGDDHE